MQLPFVLFTIPLSANDKLDMLTEMVQQMQQDMKYLRQAAHVSLESLGK